MKQDLTVFGFLIHQGTLSIVIPFIIGGLFTLALFIWWEKLVAEEGNTPLLSLDLFSNTQFMTGLGVIAVLSLNQAGTAFVLPIFLQGVKHLNAFDTGIAMLPMTLMLLVVAPLSAFFNKFVTPKRLVQAGLIISGVGLFVLRSEMQVTASIKSLMPGLMLFGAGMGLLFPQASNITLSAVSIEEAGEASGLNGTVRQVGATLGSAIIGAMLLSILTTNLTTGIQKSTVIPEQVKPGISRAAESQTSNIEFGSGVSEAGKKLPQAIADEIQKIGYIATVDAAHISFWGNIFFVIVALFISIKLPNVKNVERGKPQAAGH